MAPELPRGFTVPLLNIDWAKNGGDPFAFLVSWSEVVAGTLVAQLPADRFAAETDCSTRGQAVEAVAALVPSAFDVPPTLVAPARLTDRVTVQVLDMLADTVAAAVLFVTPDNKADSDAALAFAVRAAGLMSAGAGVVIVDITPGPPAWAAHLHSLTGVCPITRRPRNGEASVLAVHPCIQDGAERFAVWHHAVAAGGALPTVPVAVRGATHLTLDLEAAYAEACAAARLS